MAVALKASEVLESMPRELWTAGVMAEERDGRICYCADGYLAHKAGVPDDFLIDNENYPSILAALAREYGLTNEQCVDIYVANDMHGLDAVIAYLKMNSL